MESRLTSYELQLLDRLTNLSSDESSIIIQINKDIEKIGDTKTASEDKKKVLEENIITLNSEKDQLNDQFAKIVDDLKGLERDTYKVLLDKISNEFDPQALVKTIQEKAPAKISEVEEDILAKEEELTSVKESIKNNEIELAGLEQKLENANNNKGNLKKMLDEIAQGNRSITAQDITDLLQAVGLEMKECMEAGKLLLFSDALATYLELQNQKENSGKSIVEVLNDAKEAKEDSLELIEEVEITTEDSNEDAVEIIDEPTKEFNVVEELDLNDAIVIEEQSEDGTETITKEINIFAELGLDESIFSASQKDELKNIDLDIAKRNYEKLIELGNNLNDSSSSFAA